MPTPAPLNKSVQSEARKAPHATCCYPGIRCKKNHTEEDVYNIFVLSCLPENNGNEAVEVFRPMWDTVYRGLQSRSAECGYHVFLMASHHASVNFVFPVEPRKGDVVILAGHQESQRFLELCGSTFGPREVYCIWFFSELEVQGPATYMQPGLCEVWEYTRANAPKARVVRYTPPGFLPPMNPLSANDDAVQQSVKGYNFTPAGTRPKLRFIGTGSPWRDKCRGFLKKAHNRPLLANFEEFPVWGGGWRSLVTNSGVVYLNMHRYCNDSSMYKRSPRPLETVRLSLLLSMGAVVLSEQSNVKDTEIFEDLVLFEPNLFSKLPWSSKVQKVLSDKNEYMAWQMNAYKLFKEKFNPRQVMLDANVWDGGYLARGHCA